MNFPLTIPATAINVGASEIVVPAYTLKALEYSVVYSDTRKIAQVTGLHPRQCRPLVLWECDAYTAAGQWTDDDVSARVTELLGADPVAVIVALIKPPVRS